VARIWTTSQLGALVISQTTGLLRFGLPKKNKDGVSAGALRGIKR